MDLETITSRLRENGYTVHFVQTGEEAAEYLNGCIDSTDVGFGGSVTLQQIGLYEKLSSHNLVYWHWHGADKQEKEHNRICAMSTDVYVSSVNAVTEDGCLVNIDGVGNRAASMLYGHKRLYFVFSADKVVKDLNEAVERVRNVAAPMNNRRMGRDVPCAVEGGKCIYCGDPTCTIRGMSVLMRPMMNSQAEIILVAEKLGF